MNRRVFLMAAGAAAACARDARSRLNVYNWSSYIDPKMISQFEQERGARVHYGTYESNEEMLAKVAYGNSGWDVVFPTHSRLAPMSGHGLLKRLDHRMLQGLDNLDAGFRSPSWDPELRWAVPYMWNATGIAFNQAAGVVPAGWDGLWNPALSGRITMLDDAEDVLGACLLKLGLPFDSAEPAHLEAARTEAMRQKRLLRAYVNAEVRDQLAAGDVLAAQLWSTTAAQAIHSEPPGRKLAFVYPRDGFPLYCDCAAIVAQGSRVTLAHDFLSFLLRPDVAAANARAADSATTNARARLRLPPDDVLYPGRETLRRGLWPLALSSAQLRQRDRIWNQIKAG